MSNKVIKDRYQIQVDKAMTIKDIRSNLYELYSVGSKGVPLNIL